MNSVSTGIQAINWNFEDAPSNLGLHAIHPYPAKFIPQIPHHLIRLYHPGDSSIVLDPFCGSGTTLVEAIKLGVDATGIDLNPLACLIARVKITPLPDNFDLSVARVINGAQNSLYLDEVIIPSIPRLDHWFKLDVQKALAALVAEINRVEVVALREALQVAFSSIIVHVSNQDSDTRYAAVENQVTAQDVLTRFKRAAVNVEQGIRSIARELPSNIGKATVINQDILKVTADQLPMAVGLVITSPPYPNAYEYWLYHKYRMYWLGMNPIGVRESEIGARPHYFKKNHQDEHDFERQMRTCFELLSKVMVVSGKACFVVGRSIIHGREIDNAALLQRAAEPHGFIVEHMIERQISSSRKSFNLVHGKINREHLIVFSLKES